MAHLKKILAKNIKLSINGSTQSAGNRKTKLTFLLLLYLQS